jgi:transposase
MQTSLIGLEACSGAHFLGRSLRKQGHDVRLIAAQFVKPFVKSNKNDFVDAEAIAEAVERKNMRFVPIKTDDQLDLPATHRVRDPLICRRTAVINQLRAFLLERGLVFAKTPAKLRAALPNILENANLELTTQMRNLIDLLWNEWKTVEDQIEGLSLELERISAADPGCTRIRQIPGIGPIVATAIVAAIGDGAAFRKGRDFAAWLGVVPRQYSTGGKARLLGISKRGNVYLRKILIHEHGLQCCGSSGIERRSELGWMRSMPEPRKIPSWSPWQISWPASHGRCYPAEKTTDRTATGSQHPRPARKDACGLEALTRSHFTALRRRLNVYPPRSAQKQQERKNSHNGVPGNLLAELVDSNRPTNKDRYARNSSRP